MVGRPCINKRIMLHARCEQSSLQIGTRRIVLSAKDFIPGGLALFCYFVFLFVLMLSIAATVMTRGGFYNLIYRVFGLLHQWLSSCK